MNHISDGIKMEADYLRPERKQGNEYASTLSGELIREAGYRFDLQNPKVSVIVPVYNRDYCLRQCLDSIIAQTLREIEIIVVDDGSTDSTPAICDEYAAKDSRIQVIHEENRGSGDANNVGIAAARGEYVGFVDSDDWIEPEMYKSLYAKAIEHDVDVVKSLYTEIREGREPKTFNKFRVDVVNRRITDRLLIPEFVNGCISHWSAIYRREFILNKQILHPSIPGSSYHDVGFNWQVYAKMHSCYILPLSFYNYQLSNPTSAVNQGYGTIRMAFDIRYWIYDWSMREKLSDKLLERMKKDTFKMFYYGWLRDGKRWKGLMKLQIILKMSKLFKTCLPGLQFYFFSAHEKEEYLRICNHPYVYLLRNFAFERKAQTELRYIKILGVKLYEKRRSKKLLCDRILGIPYRKKVEKGALTKNYFIGIPYASSERLGNKMVKRFLGIRYGTKIINGAPEYRDVQLLQVIAHANTITNTHRTTFTKYKNCYAGKDVVLIATGPTLNYFEPLDNCIYIGVNKAAGYKKVHFDHLFFQDFCHPQAREILELISNYEGAKKFYGILQDTVRRDWIVPEGAAIRDHAERYYVISQWKYPPVHFTYDIANEPFGDRGNVAFAAMQFIMWTNPRRVFLVGSDATAESYFDDSSSINNRSMVLRWCRGWAEFKKFAQIYYPDTEIISINPIGLAGLFRDVYTERYLRKHSEVTNYILLKNYLEM